MSSSAPEGTWRARLRWPSLGDLGVSWLLWLVLSGIVLALHYQPGQGAYESVARIDQVIPFGWFLRRFHHLSAQLLLLATAGHVVSVLWRSREQRFRPWAWAKVVTLLPLVLLGCFTGFVLRGSTEGIYAATVAAGLAASIPVVGDTLARSLYRPEPVECCLLLPYLHHLATVTAGLLYLTSQHAGRLRRRPASLVWAALVAAAGALILRAPTGLPPDTSPQEVFGPWFFVGIQTLLRWLPPLSAGVLLPVGFLALLWAVPGTEGRARAVLLAALATAVLAYAGLSGWAALT